MGSKRVFDYAAEATGLTLKEYDQEDHLNVSQYVGSEDEKEPYHFKSNCDGSCSGQHFKDGGRVATMVMFCEAAEDGGHIFFRNANIKIKPKKRRCFVLQLHW